MGIPGWDLGGAGLLCFGTPKTHLAGVISHPLSFTCLGIFSEETDLGKQRVKVTRAFSGLSLETGAGSWDGAAG